ncbi:MAG TPA: TIM-barrel domain-containing protein [Lacunisphaera sp.]|nr:TIM-barrel domain-containing protein [Lacunisphaera sp.]
MPSRSTWRATRSIAFLLLASTLAAAPKLEKLADGIVIDRDGLSQKVEVRTDSIVRVAFAADRKTFDQTGFMLVPRAGAVPAWQLETGDKFATIKTARLQVRVDLATGDASFLDAAGHEVLAEAPGSRFLQPAEVQGEKTWHVRQAWLSTPDEALYGLGNNQLGALNLKGYDLDLWQHNGTAVVPFLVSSRGYGILWDNSSFSRFGDLRTTENIPPGQLFDQDGRPGGLSAEYFADADFTHSVAKQVDAKIDILTANGTAKPNPAINAALPETGPFSVRWQGSFVSSEAGVHTLEAFSNSGIKVWVDDRLVMDHWRQGWLPWFEVAHLPLEAGRHYRIKIEWSADDGMPTMQFRWKTPAHDTATSLWSEVGDGIDYYYVYGPDLAKVIAGYRQLTGAAPLMPAWAFGLWQSRQRYETAQQSLDVVHEFRRRGIPFDNIVQDWRYWPEGKWGSHQFDPTRFPDPDAWIRAIHAAHAHLMISVWGKFYPGTANFEAMHQGGYLFERNLKEGTKDWLDEPYTFYDAFNAAGGKLFWSQIEAQLFRRGIDAWWMDATEPDLRPTPTLDGQRDYTNPTALGSGARMLNAYPLYNSATIYEGQRAAAPGQRVLNLTRSAFAGQQRYAGANWSGDTSSTWTAFRKQIAAGLGFSLSGLPYWTMDIGGFSVPHRFNQKNPKPADVAEWRELNTRWFQFGTFVPLLRVHGEFPFREMWQFGGDADPAYQTQLKFDRLRYRLLPYVYSVAGAVTRDGATFLRPLVMDFRDDATAREAKDEFLFGPAFLVNPVTAYQQRSRPVYLPAAGWYDFWTGAFNEGGRTIDAAAPFDSLPLYVRAGSIVPFGPELQYAQEKPADPITLFVYAGADGSFSLYEDDGVSYAYEKGASARIELQWHDAARMLSIGAREGSFAGMPAKRTFHVVVIDPKNPVGFNFEMPAGRTVQYDGAAVELAIP